MNYHDSRMRAAGRLRADYDRGRARERSARRYVDRTLAEAGVHHRTRQETGARILRPEENED